MKWRCDEEQAEGLSVLAIARPGLQLSSTILPRVIFHVWIADTGERLLRGYAGLQQVREQELSLLIQGVAVIGAAAGSAR